jgi:hypothetical protein
MIPEIVIGSGPVGATAALNLLQQGKEVLMLDIGERNNETPEALTKAKKLNLKLISNSSQTYDFNQFNIILGEKRNWFTSKTMGGHSLVWGATWKSTLPNAKPEWEEAIRKATVMLGNYYTNFNDKNTSPKMMCTCFDRFLKKNLNRKSDSIFQITKSQIAVNSNTCDFTGTCHSFCEASSIWSSLELLKMCEKYPKFIYQDASFVNSFEIQSGCIKAQTTKGEVTGENLYLAAGPIGNALILLRSKVTDEIRLHDTQMITVPMISFFRKKSHAGKFALAGLTIDGKDFVGNNYHIQIYAHPDTFQDRIIATFPKIFRLFAVNILKFIQSRLFIAIVYFDANLSGELILQMKEVPMFSKISFNRNSEGVKSIKKTISKELIKLGIVPIWLLEKVAGVGDSYHVGATESLPISRNGEIVGLSRIKVLGSLALQEVEPGPVTSMSMAQAILSTTFN